MIINSSSIAFPESPSFNIQQIIDEHSDWINMTTREIVKEGERSTDILAINYFSDGKFFNATLWLLSPFNEMPSYPFVKYGMLIDADFNSKTGFGINGRYGIDYQLEIQWNDETGTWTKILQAWSPNGGQRTIDKTDNYTGFFEKGNDFVLLPLDLSSILYPEKYKVMFYAETIEGNYVTDPSVADITRWVAVPPLEILMSTVPSSLTLRQGEERTVELRVNSTRGYEPTINLSNRIPFTEGIMANIKFETLRIPSSGIGTTPITIKATESSDIRPHTIFIIANSTFPPEKLIESKESELNNDGNVSIFPYLPYESESIVSELSMMVTTQEPLTTIDSFGNFWDKLNEPITFFYGIIAGVTPWLFFKIKERVKNKENNDDKENKKNDKIKK